jgi:hypothetical protein
MGEEQAMTENATIVFALSETVNRYDSVNTPIGVFTSRGKAEQYIEFRQESGRPLNSPMVEPFTLDLLVRDLAWWTVVLRKNDGYVLHVHHTGGERSYERARTYNDDASMALSVRACSAEAAIKLAQDRHNELLCERGIDILESETGDREE